MRGDALASAISNTFTVAAATAPSPIVSTTDEARGSHDIEAAFAGTSD